MKENSPKVLVCCPTSSAKEYCQEEYIKNFHELTYPNKELFMVDNSDDRTNSLELKRLGAKVKYVNPKEMHISELIAKSHEECRLYAVKHNFDIILHKESDIISPPDTIERLMAHNKPVAHAMYHIEFGEKSHLMITLKEEDGEVHREMQNLELTDLAFVDGSLKRVYGAGLGCALIRRKVFTKIKFRYKKEALTQPSDSWFSYDLHQLGIPNYLDTSLLCEHLNSPWVRRLV